jgi:two-component system, NarL family, invasion response regulator UvrY
LIRVLIADDHPVVRKGLVHILTESGDVTIAAEASNAQEVLQALASGIVADVIVLDVNMPGRSGLDLIPDLRRDYPAAPILMLSQYPAEQIAVRAIRSGASGYLNKESAPEMLLAAVKRLQAGRKFIPPEMAELLAEAVEGKGDNPHQGLSAREFDVFIRLASGKAVSEIGEELHLSIKTVSTYRTRVMEKMSLKTNADLSLYAIRAGLME